jgi:hypothetical protein
VSLSKQGEVRQLQPHEEFLTVTGNFLNGKADDFSLNIMDVSEYMCWLEFCGF